MSGISFRIYILIHADRSTESYWKWEAFTCSHPSFVRFITHLCDELNVHFIRCLIFMFRRCSGKLLELSKRSFSTKMQLICETRIIWTWLYLINRLNWPSTAVTATCICWGISPLKRSNCPYETLSLITPFFSLWLCLTLGYCCQATAHAWKTSCLGHCSPPNTFIQRSSDYFSSFIWATKHSPTPNLPLCWKREPSRGEQSRRGCWREGVCG